MQGNLFCGHFERLTFHKGSYFPGFSLPMYKICYDINKIVVPNPNFVGKKLKIKQVGRKLYEI